MEKEDYADLMANTAAADIRNGTDYGVPPVIEGQYTIEDAVPVEPIPADTFLPCRKCQERATEIDDLKTLVVNLAGAVMDLTRTVDGMHSSLHTVVDALNVVGQQNNWIVEQAGNAFTAFAQMRETLANGGVMSLLKGMSG